ncbi:auxin-responsive protein SAUR22-like [Primulina huaijiensis]|uniref:auxin-responsive protein SAUR22-like n=1 Tax=Primulina huaijiensis TaxID=1492673 RepID=UPI003CC75971
MKRLAKKVRSFRNAGEPESSHSECLLRYNVDGGSSPTATTSPSTTGTFAVYVGEDRQRFMVPTSYLNHPLFKMMLEKAYNEFGFDQRNGLVVPCSVATFREVMSVVGCCNGRFDLGELVEEFI